MKKFIQFVLSIAVISALASSCDDLLKPESPSSYDEATVYSNYNLAEGTIYGIVQAFGIDKSYRNRFLPWYGYNTDVEWYNTYTPGADGGKSDIGIYNCLPNNGQLDEAEGCYTLMYTAIERANLTISGLRKYGNVEEDADMAYLLGEALTLRAMIYYDLCKAWGDVPARFEPLESETIYIGRSSRDVIFNQLLTDLDEAIAYLPYPGETAATRRTDRANKVFAEGLYAR
ncbi:MAG: RagB/SusD family nutrient uptake outer membrane protein, partial [Bacteroidales bacterium]|nr:RagB/SusD family nutrient uptake outer membrane protein [Bacteroidales bacterium]